MDIKKIETKDQGSVSRQLPSSSCPRKRKADDVSDSETEYDIKTILRSRIHTTKAGETRAEFHVKWDKSEVLTWEPMEQLSHCPLLLESFETRHRAKMVKIAAKSKVDASSFGNFPTVSKDFLKKWRNPKEHIPKGNETVKHIAYEMRRDERNIFWFVSFMKDKNMYFVRKCLMEYYFPCASAYFHLNMVKKEKKIQHFLENSGH
jgi:hypothetical protein